MVKPPESLGVKYSRGGRPQGPGNARDIGRPELEYLPLHAIQAISSASTGISRHTRPRHLQASPLCQVPPYSCDYSEELDDHSPQYRLLGFSFLRHGCYPGWKNSSPIETHQFRNSQHFLYRTNRNVLLKLENQLQKHPENIELALVSRNKAAVRQLNFERNIISYF